MGKVKVGTKYAYETGKYVREKLGEKPKDAVGYRIVKLPRGRRLLVAIRKKKGPRGGRTKAVALLRPRKGRSLKGVVIKKLKKRRSRRR